MTGAIFYDAICTAPWGFAVPRIQDVADVLAPGTECLVGYHLVVEGRAVAEFEDGAEVRLAPGDVVIVPHGDPHTVRNGRPSALTDSRASICSNLTGHLSTYRIGGGGEVTRFVCGYFGCERHAARLFLAGLPRVITINVRGDSPGGWLESSIRYLLSESASSRPGRAALLSKMAEALFIETLRRYMREIPPEATGWLAGARDAVVGAALALLHRSPAHAWTISKLATEVGAARSVVAERFARFLGEPPMTYLAHWRLELAARLLQTTRKKILEVAIDVGYDSEASFNRAFKREFGVPPGQFRGRQTSPDRRAAARIHRLHGEADARRGEEHSSPRASRRSPTARTPPRSSLVPSPRARRARARRQ
jgi:AraC-like DNA-binding protein